MSNEKSPYDSFYKNDSTDGSSDDAPTSPGLAETDRGAPTLKVEQDTPFNKNIVIAGVMIIFTLLGVFGFMALLFNRMSSGDSETAPVVANAALDKQETESLANIKARMETARLKEEAAAKLERERLAALAKQRLEAKKSEVKEKEAAAAAAAPPPPMGNLKSSSSEKPLSQRKPAELTEAELAHLRKGQGDVLGYTPQAKQVESGQSELKRPSSLGNMLITERHANGLAYLRKSRQYLLLRGTNIPCTILPRVITNYFSQPTCIVNEDIYSPDGVVLIDRGSKVLGEQRTALKKGDTRVFVAWADIETPEGVSIKVDSMAADALGGAGVDAWIDNHWVERFGSAILLSFMDDLFETIANSQSNTEQSTDNSTNNASSMSQIALEDSINIKPTGYIMPAKQVTIIVARDIDFTSIYETR